LFTVGTANGLSPHDAPFLPILTHPVNKKNAGFFAIYSEVIHSPKSRPNALNLNLSA
jgi:hypothetical protein